MRQILRIQFGSHLYGTSTPASDLDFKSIFVPDGRSILLQRAKQVHNDQRPKAEREKNYAGEVEEERFSLQRFLELASQGQTVALDVLFAPAWAATDEPAPEWAEVISNRHRLLTRKSAAFIGYARQQANKYGIRGSRVAAARAALGLLHAALSATDKLGGLDSDIRSLISSHDHMGLIEDTTPHGQKVLLWEVCNRKMPYTASIKNAYEIMRRVVDEYGKRALMAESQQGIDWKALSHAVRVGSQAVELLQTGFVTFPLPNAVHVIEIKQGNLPYHEVATEIEDWLVRVEAAAAASTLPDEPDLAWIDNFVADVYRKEVIAG